MDSSRHRHAYILKQFRAHFVDTHEIPASLHARILQIKSARESADYSVAFQVSRKRAASIVTTAGEVLAVLATFFRET